MLSYFGIDNDLLIVIVSALAAAISFAAVALPLLNRTEKKERYRNVIEKKRKDLFEATREQARKGYRVDEGKTSARESMAMFYKVQQLAGKMGAQLRAQMFQAGIRDPKAPIKFLIARIVLPVLLVSCAMVILSSSDREIEPFTKFAILMGMGVFGFFLPKLLLKNMAIKRQEEIALTFPDALDMMLICVQGGIGLEQAIHRVAEEIAEHSPTLAEEMGILSAELGMLNDRRAALADFAKRVGSGSARSFATAMIQAEQYGTSVVGAMRVIADDLRDQRMAEAERKAASLPPKLTVPMILFFLPALFIVILGPAGINASGSGIGG